MKFMKRLSMRVITGVLVSCILVWLNPRGLRTFALDVDPNILGFQTYFSTISKVNYKQLAYINTPSGAGDTGGTLTCKKVTNGVCENYSFSGGQIFPSQVIELPTNNYYQFESGYTPYRSYQPNQQVTVTPDSPLTIIYLLVGNNNEAYPTWLYYYGNKQPSAIQRKTYSANGNRYGAYVLGAFEFTSQKSGEVMTIGIDVPVGSKLIPIYWGNSNNIPDNIKGFINMKTSTQETNQNLSDINQGIKDTNDTLKNDNVDGASGSAGGFFEGFDSDFGGLTGIITAPLVFINSLASSCNDLDLPLGIVPGNLKLPCAKTIYTQYFGPLYNIYVTLTDGLVAYFVVKGLFRLFEDMKDPDKSRVDVIDL